MKARLRNFLLFAVAMAASWYVGAFVSPTFSVTETTLDVQMAESGQPYYIARGERAYFDAVPIADSRLAAAAAGGEPPGITAALSRRTRSSTRSCTGDSGRCCRQWWR